MARLWISDRPRDESNPPLNWPLWFQSFVALGSMLRLPSTFPLSGSEFRYTLVLAVPTARLVGVPIALGLVGASLASDPRHHVTLNEAELQRVAPGTVLRIIEHPTSDRATVLVGTVSRFSRSALGKATVIVDTIGRNRQPVPKTYNIEGGRTQFQSFSGDTTKGRVEIDEPEIGMLQWVRDNQYLDYVLSSSADLLWVGDKNQIEDDLEYRVARAETADLDFLVPVRSLIRPRQVGSRAPLGWHVELASTSSPDLPQSRFDPWRVSLFDGNRAIARHASLSPSAITVCVLDGGQRTKQVEASSLLEDRARWSELQPLGILKPWTPPAGVQAVLFKEAA